MTPVATIITIQPERRSNPRCPLLYHCSCGSAAGTTARIANTSPTATTTDLTGYPNPLTDHAIVEFNLLKAGKYSFEVYDMKGALIEVLANDQGETGKFVSLELHAENYKYGVYLVKPITDSNATVKRIVIQK